MKALQHYWNSLAARERALILAAALLIGTAAVWQLLLAPALQTLRQAPARHAALDAQWQRMQALQAQVQQLQQAPRTHTGDTLQALQSSLARELGSSAELTSNGPQVTITFTNTPANALAQWLAQVRSITHATPLQAELARARSDNATDWNGTLILALPTE